MNVNQYETTVIFDPNLSKAALKSALDKYRKLLKQEKVKVVDEEDQGVQNLAYPIQKHVCGIYYVVRYEAAAGVVEKLERAYCIDENVLRFLSVKLGKHGVAYHEKRRTESAKEPKEALSEEDTRADDAAEDKPLTLPTEPHGKKYCRFTKFGIKYIDYKEKNFLARFLNPQAKILPRRITGNSAKSQRMVDQAIKRSRHLACLPYVADNFM